MKALKFIKLIFLVLLWLLLILFYDLFGQTFVAEFVYPGSLNSNHEKADGMNEDNGGLGLIATIKGSDKFYNVGFGRIWFVNSFENPGRADIIQLSEAEADFEYVRFGFSVWKMWLCGYKREGESIIIDIPPWPVPFVTVQPTNNLSVSARYINLITVSITFITINYRWRL